MGTHKLSTPFGMGFLSLPTLIGYGCPQGIVKAGDDEEDEESLTGGESSGSNVSSNSKERWGGSGAVSYTHLTLPTMIGV